MKTIFLCFPQREEVEDDMNRFRHSADGLTLCGVKRIRRSPTILDPTNSERMQTSRATAKRRRRSLLESARQAHGGTPEDDAPTTAGLFNTLVHVAQPEQLTTLMSTSPTVTKKVLPAIVSPHVNSFNSSKANEVRSLAIMYRGGILSKRKYSAVVSSGMRQYCERDQRTKYLHLMNGVRVDRLLPYKDLVKVIRSEDIGQLNDIPIAADGHARVAGFFRPLKATVTVMADLFLSNKRMRHTLNWFGQENTFRYAIGGDGAPYGKADEQMTIWCVSFLNRGRRMGSPQDNFLLVLAQCSEGNPAILQYARNLVDEIAALDQETITICGRPCRFVCDMLICDMKYLATLSGELPNSATYFSSFADVSDKNKKQEKGCFLLDGASSQVQTQGDTFIWRPWDYNKRVEVAAKVETFKAALTGDLDSKENRKK